MKAIRIHKYGGPQTMQLEEVERPVPAFDEILVKVYASGINPVDFVVREGKDAALSYNLNLPLVLGWDASGIIEEVGNEVTIFKKGDAVYGIPNFPGDGSYAEYCVAKASRFALKPQSLNFNEAAGVPLVAITAWTGLFAHGNILAGQRVLIHGASGGVGSFATQFAKAKGAYVIGITSSDNIDYVRNIGADEVIDYKKQKFENVVHHIDMVLEASSIRDNNERVKLVSVLNEKGKFISVNTDFPFNNKLLEIVNRKKIIAKLSPNQPKQEWLHEIAKLIDNGTVQIPKNKVFTLPNAADAHLLGESKSYTGKLILEIRKENE